MDDPYDLHRFVVAQQDDYARALAELEGGRKRSHWMWYIFPQLAGLGSSATSVRFSIKSVPEARAYLAHPLLGPRLVQCTEAVLRIEGRSANQIFGSPDDMKLQSCATLFAALQPPGSPFERVLSRYFAGQGDRATLQLLQKLSVNDAPDAHAG